MLHERQGISMMMSSNGNIFTVTGYLCGNSPVPGEVPTQRPVTRGFDVLFDVRLNQRLSKQSWGWWFERPSHSLWRHGYFETPVDPAYFNKVNSINGSKDWQTGKHFCSSRAIVLIIHFNDVLMSAMASQITRLTIVYSIVCSVADQRKYQSSASLAFVRGIYRPITRKMFPFDEVIMYITFKFPGYILGLISFLQSQVCICETFLLPMDNTFYISSCLTF